MIAIGIMSGTSLDGIDAARVRIEPQGDRYRIELQAFATTAFDASLLNDLRGALPPAAGSTVAIAALHRRLGDAFARAAASVIGGGADFIAMHGQTLWHDGERATTLQIGDPFAVREATGATVCYDFRAADCAVGGHGAPLVPIADRLLLASPQEERVALNIGGIANITVLPAGGTQPIVAFDTGPGMMAIDALVTERTAGRMRWDEQGALARSGRPDDAALARLLADPYFAAPPPKSTGRERFGAQWTQPVAALGLEDAAATLTAATAASIAKAIRSAAPRARRVLVSGGGLRNPLLIAMLAERLAGVRVESTAVMGLDPDAKEAIAFAVLGYETLRGRAVSLPSVTGARRAVPLGAVAPLRLHELLARMERECAR